VLVEFAPEMRVLYTSRGNVEVTTADALLPARFEL
jgi:hypothetical protein